MRNACVFFLLFVLMACTSHAPSNQAITMQEFQQRFDAATTMHLLDVRTEEEFIGGSIQGALNINVFSPNFVVDASKTFAKQDTIYVFCRKGKRSAKATKLLVENGFEHVINVQGGYLAWKKRKKQ